MFKKIELPEQEIIEKYLANESLQKIAIKYNVSSSVIRNRLVKNNIKIRKSTQKIIFDDKFLFSKTPEAYYFWGFILGDGCLSEKGPKDTYKALTITLNEKDKNILSKFCNWLKINDDNIKYYKNTVRLNLFGSLFQIDLSKFGCVPTKTYNPVIPNIENQFIKPFILGLIDADGSVAWKKPRTDNNRPITNKKSLEHSISLVGNQPIINWTIEKLREINFNGNINTQLVNNKSQSKRWRVQRIQDVLDLAQILEIDKYESFILQRKWSKLIEDVKLLSPKPEL